MTETERENMPAVIAICRGCNRIVFASVNDATPERKKELAREVAKMIRAGYSIQEWPVEKVRAAKWMCECPKKKKKGVDPETGSASEPQTLAEAK